MRGLNQYFRGWIAYFRVCTAAGAAEFQRYDAHARRRLRAIVMCQRKRPRFLYRHLLKRGASPKQAAHAAYGGGIWRRSLRRGMTKAYPNEWFQEFFVPLYDRWLLVQPPAPVQSQLCLAW